jgi:hypothetical protein
MSSSRQIVLMSSRGSLSSFPSVAVGVLDMGDLSVDVSIIVCVRIGNYMTARSKSVR